MKKLSAAIAATVLALTVIVVGPGLTAVAEETAPIVMFEQVGSIAVPGEGFGATTVRVLGEGAAVVGATVTFEVEPGVGDATVELDVVAVVTDAHGTASVFPVAVGGSGSVKLTAMVSGGSASAWLYVRGPGFSAGEELASVVGEDQDGVMRDIRDDIHKRNYTIIDTCAGWCGPCQAYAEVLRDATAVLAADHGVELQIVTLLGQGFDFMPSTRGEAVAWRESLSLTNDVMHAGGRFDSEVYVASQLIVTGADGYPGFPTSLLVGPDGMIIDRVVGNQGSVDAVVQRVLDADQKTKKNKEEKQKKNSSSDVRVTAVLDGVTTSGVFTGEEPMEWHDFPTGAVGLLVEDADPAHPVLEMQYSTLGGPLPESGPLSLTLTRYDGTESKQDLVETSVPLYLLALSEPYEYETQVVVETTMEVTSKNGVTTALMDLVDLREILQAKLQTGQYDVYPDPGVLTEEQIGAFVANLMAVQVRLTFER